MAAISGTPGRARHTGIESELHLWFAGRYQEGQVIEVHYCWACEEALAAAALDE